MVISFDGKTIGPFFEIELACTYKWSRLTLLLLSYNLLAIALPFLRLFGVPYYKRQTI